MSLSVAALMVLTAGWQQPDAPTLSWSDRYWAAQTQFQRCFDQELRRAEQTPGTAQARLDTAILHCQREWQLRTAELRNDLHRQRPTWTAEMVNSFVERRYREFYDLRLQRLRQHYGEVPQRVMY